MVRNVEFFVVRVNVPVLPSGHDTLAVVITPSESRVAEVREYASESAHAINGAYEPLSMPKLTKPLGVGRFPAIIGRLGLKFPAVIA